MSVFTPLALGAVSLGMGIAEKAGAFGGGGQQGGDIPGTEGNPMTQNSMSQQQPQQQTALSLNDQENPFAGGLPGGGGWMR
jgi:hypothetical protein